MASPLGGPPPRFVDVAAPAPGVADHGHDPAVVAVERGDRTVCAGALVAPVVVLTARHCAASGVAGVFVRATGDASAAGPRAAVRDALVPPDAGGPDLAILVLDTPLDGVVPLVVRATGAALGDHVRAVSFETPARGGSAVKVVRDHVPVVASGAVELSVSESPCGTGCGGPLLDETSAAIVGVLSGASVAPGGVQGVDVAVRADVFLPFIASVLQANTGPRPSTGALRTSKGPVDMGAACAGAVDCAAGVCVSDGPRRYCSRPCGPADTCPARSRCGVGTSDDGATFDACIQAG
jgi:hypothetical protein